MRTGILLTSRNNYDLMGELWCKKIHSHGMPMLNIDEDSSPSQKKLGKQVCLRYGVHYIDREKRGLQNNLTTAVKFFGDDIDYLVWFQTDCWPLDKDFFHKFNSMVESGSLSDFGTIGFNVLATDVVKNYDAQISLYKKGEKPLGILARCPLEGRLYYTGYGRGKIKELHNQDKFRVPFAVESPEWTAIALNVKNFKKFIKPTSQYEFFHAWDDISFQFLNENVYNIVLPDLYVCHRPDLKPKYGIPVLSVTMSKGGDDRFHGKWGHLEVWQKRWGWDWGSRDSFAEVIDRYKNTLLYDFYNHDSDTGPLKTFKIKE